MVSVDITNTGKVKGDEIKLAMKQQLHFMGIGSKGIFLSIITILMLAISCDEQNKIDFNTEVRPILNKNCIGCHGGVKQSGGFGLVFKENALGKTKNGKIGIVPGHPEKSEMIARITHEDPEMRMPPEREPLKQEEIDILVGWIEQGAKWQEHWAYIKPEEPQIPRSASKWVKNEIDHFILSKIEENDLLPSEKADKYDLVRRLYLDLTGLPPSLDQVDNFINDNSENAYEKLVDKLLASSKYGEHWASMWLDLARFADSKGYAQDAGREIWKYRDWVIKAFNTDMPFDQFTIEQLAGDLMPDPTLDQLVATAFHRNTLNNNEGGTSNEEYRIAAVIDRVNTTWEVWQSTTMSCVQCHSHPYDPIRHSEYYESFAFFNNSSDWDVPAEHPLLKELETEDSVKLEEIKKWITSRSSRREANKWERFILVNEPKLRAEDFDETENTAYYNRSTQDFMQARNNSYIRINGVQLENIERIYLSYEQRRKHNGTLLIRTDSLKGNIIGKALLVPTTGKGPVNLPVKLTIGLKKVDLFFQFQSTSDDYVCYIDGFSLGEKLPGDRNEDYELVYKEIDKILNAPYRHSTPILVEKHKDYSRETNVFVRGNWLVKGDKVLAGIPKLLNYAGKEYYTRMDMAKWLVSEDNPLTGRVMVNRFWSKLFGTGIVPTVEDFGTLGDYPSHPGLLDWLALRFSNEWGWSMKKLLKTIVMSATYRQSSKVSEVAEKKDPNNRWLSRSPRVRLTAEQIRDQALAVSGLLSDKMYGPSVMPLQPEGIWKVAFGSEKWVLSEGEDAYRRGLYTYIKRSSPFPSFITFDGSGREFCLSRRINTNTPLQALVTLNDPVYFEAAKALAQQVLPIKGNKKTIVETAYQKVMGKMPGPEKSEILVKLLNDTEHYYQEHKQEGYELAKSENLNLASLIVMTNMLMNMDEFIVKN